MGCACYDNMDIRRIKIYIKLISPALRYGVGLKKYMWKFTMS